MSSPIAFSTKDNASGQLSSGINASVLSIPLGSGEGANFPQPYNGSATSLGSSTALNSTGISAIIGGSGAVGKWIWNKTDGSIARILSVATHVVTTTRLIGGTDNTWQNSDVWSIDPLVVTFEKVSTNAYGVQETTQREEALIIGRSTDTFTVATAGRGYNGTTANTFATDDFVYLHVTSPIIERLIDLAGEIAEHVDTNVTDIAAVSTDLASTANGEGASLVGIEDAGGNYTGTTVEAALTEIDTRLDATISLSQMGIYGDASDGTPTWIAGATLTNTGEFEYSTATLPVSQTVTVSTNNVPLVIKTSGDVTINGTLDLNEKGAAGGAAVTTADTTGNVGSAGGTILSGVSLGVNGGSGGGFQTATDRGGGGGGGASVGAVGGTGSTNNGAAGGAGGTHSAAPILGMMSDMLRGVSCGGGGASGGRANTGTSGAGGRGGGAAIWFIGGDLTLGASSVIRANGAAGGNSSAVNIGAGGGGGGGAILIIVRGSITNSGATLTATGGGGGGTGTTGGAGAAGKVIIYSLSTGTLITS